MEYMQLVGAETVQSAGHTMQRAADDMNRAASSITGALEQHRRWADEWLQQFKAILEDDVTVRRQS